MSDAFYDEMCDMASELLAEFSQGTVRLKREAPGTIDPDQPWLPVAPSVSYQDLSATVKRLHQRYENGALIIETGDLVLFAVPEVVPLTSDIMVIDEVERSITNLTPVPGAGTTVFWKAWCAL